MSAPGIGSERLGNEYPQSGAPLLIVLGICLLSVALLLSQFAPPVLVFGILGLIVACIVVPASWPYGAFLVLGVASVMPRVKVDIGGWNARPEHYASLLVLIIFLIRWLSHRRSRIAWNSPDYWVAAYVAWNYVSSVLMSPDPKMTLRWALLNNLVVLPYFLIRFLIDDEDSLRWTFKAFLGIGIFECGYAFISYMSSHLLGTSFGVEVGQYAAGFEGVYGTQYEPNILGSFSSCLALTLLVLVFLSPRRSKWIVVGTIIALASLLISLSRAAFLSFIFGSVILLIIGVRKGLVSPKKVLALSVGLVLFLAPIAASGGRNLVARFANLSGDQFQGDVEAMGRLVSWTVALQDIAQHPIVGNGTASFQLLADYKDVPILGEHAWVSNSVVRILHDTGLIGLLLFTAAALTGIKQIKKAVSQTAIDKTIVIALSAGCLAYAVAFMSAEGTMLSFFWVHLGLLMSACTVVKQAAVDNSLYEIPDR